MYSEDIINAREDMPGHDLPKTWIIIRDGQIVKNHAIEGVALAQLILDIQHALDNIGFSRYGKDYKKEDCRLYFSEILPGSAVIPAYPATYGTCLDGSRPFVDITGSFERLIHTLNTNPEQFQSLLDQEVESQPERIGVLKSLLSLASSGSQIEINTTVDRPTTGSFVPKNKVEYLEELVFEYGGTGTVSIHGIIVELNGENPYYFKVKTKNGINVRCYFKPDIEDLVKSLYKGWVKVVGNMTRSQRAYKIDPVEVLEAQKTEELCALGRYSLLKPITFQVSYDRTDSLWCLENYELALDGYGSTYAKAILCLGECLERHVLSFTLYPDDEHSSESLLIKEELKKYVDFEQVTQYLAHRDGDQ